MAAKKAADSVKKTSGPSQIAKEDGRPAVEAWLDLPESAKIKTVSPLEGAEEGPDRWATEQGWLPLTPLRLDLTHEAQLRAVRANHLLDEAMAAAVSPTKSSDQAAPSVVDDEAPVSVAVNAGRRIASGVCIRSNVRVRDRSEMSPFDRWAIGLTEG